MNDTYISFYLRANRIHIFVDALRGIRHPKYICFMIEENGKKMIVTRGIGNSILNVRFNCVPEIVVIEFE